VMDCIRTWRTRLQQTDSALAVDMGCSSSTIYFLLANTYKFDMTNFNARVRHFLWRNDQWAVHRAAQTSASDASAAAPTGGDGAAAAASSAAIAASSNDAAASAAPSAPTAGTGPTTAAVPPSASDVLAAALTASADASGASLAGGAAAAESGSSSTSGAAAAATPSAPPPALTSVAPSRAWDADLPSVSEVLSSAGVSDAEYRAWCDFTLAPLAARNRIDELLWPRIQAAEARVDPTVAIPLEEQRKARVRKKQEARAAQKVATNYEKGQQHYVQTQLDGARVLLLHGPWVVCVSYVQCALLCLSMCSPQISGVKLVDRASRRTATWPVLVLLRPRSSCVSLARSASGVA
jgi:hypothetical protein